MTTPTSPSPVIAADDWPAGTRRPRMQGHVVFVTGGTRGIGVAISRSFAEQGATVAAGYSRDHEHARKLLNQLREHGVDASVHRGNVGSAEDCRQCARSSRGSLTSQTSHSSSHAWTWPRNASAKLG